MITRLHIENFKTFGTFDLSLNPELNIIVGNNESGKSTILEAIALALTKRINGRQADSELTPYLFNKDVVAAYVADVQQGRAHTPPRILIEVTFEESADVAALKGTINHDKADACGVSLEISFNDDFAEEYQALLSNGAAVKTIPTEYYCVRWCSFAGSSITSRAMPVGLSYIDATTIRLQSGTDFYLQSIIANGLEPRERAALAVAYRALKEKFSDEDAIKAINEKLTQRKGAITDKDLTITIDVSQKSNWETSLAPHLDDLPFTFIGKGEQSALKIMLALERQVEDAHVILIEEPENHLSFASMRTLIHKIRERCKDKQIIVTTHSAYVLNKLGMEQTILLHDGATASFSSLPPDTEKYFKKLSGFDTLRLILSKHSVLVEGPSDELIAQKAYFKKHGHPAADDGVDIMSVGGLSFPRFLDIAVILKKPVTVITDNDGDYQGRIVDRYAPYAGVSTIDIRADQNETLRTLEYHMVELNSLDLMNRVLGTAYGDKESLLAFMLKNKTEWALRVLETIEEVAFPDYLKNAL